MIYTLHMDANAKPLPGDEEGASRFDSLVAVPDGVAKWAIIFAPFWLAYHRLWFALAIYVLLTIFVVALLATPFILIPLLLGGLPGLYLFLEGNQLRRSRLERNGLPIVGVVDAEDEQSAIEKFLAHWTDEDAPRATKGTYKNSTLRPASSGPTFGMFPAGEA